MSAEASTESTTASGAAGAPLQLGLLLAVAVGLRSYRLDAPLWYDEIVTLVEYVRLAPSDLLTHYTSTNNHLLYSLLAHASVAGFGESAWALRLPAALLGVASLAAFWWMAHEFVAARQARLASWAIALSYHHVWFSQNARGYTGILLSAWLGTALFLRARRGGPARLWLAYAVALALGTWIHLSTLFVFAAHGIVYLAEELVAQGRDDRRFDARPLAALAGGLLLALALYAPLLPELAETLTSQHSAGRGSNTVTTWKSPVWTLLEAARGLQLGGASPLVALLGVGLAGCGLISFARSRPGDALLLTAPGAIAIAALLAAGFNIWPRYFLVSLGFAAILGVRGAFSAAGLIVTSPTRAEHLATAACITGIALSAATLPLNYRYPKQDYPAARSLIVDRRGADEPVLALGLADYAYGRYFEPGWGTLESVEQLDRLEEEHASLWIVYSFPTLLRASRPELFARVERGYERVRSFHGTLGDGDVHVLRSRSVPTRGRQP
ncbi:MAG: glycosyltransferase family 39 protein [Myxococcota bacterium]|nr:glycosyltransferase family 39 protein [Myxococcota bacterium]